MYRYFISLLFVFTIFLGYAQEVSDAEPVADSLVYKEKYGLRIGADAYKLARTAFDEDYTGFEVNGDFRLTKKLYVAGELGFEEKTTTTDFLSSTANGSYFKAGVDYNFYQNWFGLENMLYAGIRTGFSSFKQTVNGYTVYNVNQSYPQTIVNESTEFSGLTAIWAELIIGLKAQTFNNLYVGMNVQFKRRITETEPDNFENIFIPGFGRTYDSGEFGVTLGYNISYLIPLYKKQK